MRLNCEMLCTRNHVANTLLTIITLIIQLSHANSENISFENENIGSEKIESFQRQGHRNSTPEKKQSECTESITTVNNERVLCKNELIFEERFHGDLNDSIWTREIRIPLKPDYEFCVYRNDGIVRTHDGMLEITPKILEDSYGNNTVYIGKMILADCTSNVVEECQREATGYHILQPIISGRLSTKQSFNFRYGKIEINAKFPQGDWLFPEMYLLPRYESIEDKYAFAKVILGLARGNDILYDDEKEYGGKFLEFGFRFGDSDHFQYKNITKFRHSGAWTKDFHKYTTVWSDVGMTFLVDGTKVGFINLQEEFEDPTSKLRQFSPFEQEFYLALGVGVGGLHVFFDDLVSDQYSKPWRNLGAKAMLNFWKAKNQWLPSWKRQNGSEAKLKIKSIRIWSV